MASFVEYIEIFLIVKYNSFGDKMDIDFVLSKLIMDMDLAALKLEELNLTNIDN